MLAPSLNQPNSSTGLANFSQNNLNRSHKTIKRGHEYNPLQKAFYHPDLWNCTAITIHLATMITDWHDEVGITI